MGAFAPSMDACNPAWWIFDLAQPPGGIDVSLPGEGHSFLIGCSRRRFPPLPYLCNEFDGCGRSFGCVLYRGNKENKSNPSLRYLFVDLFRLFLYYYYFSNGKEKQWAHVRRCFHDDGHHFLLPPFHLIYWGHPFFSPSAFNGLTLMWIERKS